MQADIGVEFAAHEFAPQRRPARAVGQRGNGGEPPRAQGLQNAGGNAIGQAVIVGAERDGFDLGHCAFRLARSFKNLFAASPASGQSLRDKPIYPGPAGVYNPYRAARPLRRRAGNKEH